MARATAFLTHHPDELAHYYGPRALAALEAVVAVRHSSGREAWNATTLAAAAQGCEFIVSNRTAEAGAELFDRLPGLLAFCRCAVDIRNVDVAAASARGILVTQASPGFITSVTEWVVGAMIDLSRHISRSVLQYRVGQTPTVSMGRELRGATLVLRPTSFGTR